MAKKQEKEIEKWVTVNGARVPIFKDGSIGGPKALRDKVKAVQEKKTAVRNYENKSFNGMVLDMKKDGFSIADTGNTGRGGLKDGATLSVYDKNTKQYHKAIYHKDKNGKSSIDIQKKETKKSGVTRKDVEELTAKKDKLKGTKLKTKPISDEEVKTMKENNVFTKKAPEHITGAKSVNELHDKLKSQGLSMESADAEDIRRDYRSMNGEKVSLYDKDGNEYRGTFNRYSDGGTEIVNIKKERYNTKDDDIKEKQIARNKKEADERNGKTKESYEPYEPQDAEEWAQDLYESDNYVGDEHIEEQLERELRGTEGAKRYDIEDYEVIRNEDGGRYGDVKVRYALEFEDGLEHREGVYRLRVRDLPAGSKEEEAYQARIAKKKKEAKANMSPRAKASQMSESQLRAYVKKNNLTKSYNIMMNTRPGAYGYSKQLQVLRDLVADDMARRKKK